MKLKKIALFMVLQISLNLFAQGETKILVVKAKLVDNISVVGIRQLKVTSDDLRKVMIKTKIESDKENKTKLSAFSLLDTQDKTRYRLADYKGYTGFIGNPELIPFRKDKIYNDKGKEINGDFLPPYDESEKDYFNEFDKEGYTNLEMKIDFGTTRSPKLSVVYFGETRHQKFTAALYFAIIEVNKNHTYELYYKDEKISDIQFE